MTGETVLITSYLEAEQVARIRAAWPGEVHYDEALVPRPRYVADHGGERPDLDSASEHRWLDLLARADIAFDFDWFAPDRMLANCPRLNWVQATSAGIGGFVERYGLQRDGLVLTTAAGVHSVPLAEFAVTGTLFFVRGVPTLLERSRSRSWQRYTATTLAGRRVAVVGLGSIGRQTVAAFHALGAQVVGVGRPGRVYALPDGVVATDTDDLDAVLATSDVLVLATPLTEHTRGMIDRRRIGLLRPGAVVVNVARGQLIDQPALLEALDERRLLGAALDVTDPEPPPPDDPIWARDDVLLSPHSASTVPSENAAIVDIFLDNLARWSAGEPLRNRYDPREGY